jgi:hypothetical protein
MKMNKSTEIIKVLRWKFDYRAECRLYVGHFYCSACGLWITSCPLKPAELAALLGDACEDCGEPLAVTLRTWRAEEGASGSVVYDDVGEKRLADIYGSDDDL